MGKQEMSGDDCELIKVNAANLITHAHLPTRCSNGVGQIKIHFKMLQKYVCVIV